LNVMKKDKEDRCPKCGKVRKVLWRAAWTGALACTCGAAVIMPSPHPQPGSTAYPVMTAGQLSAWYDMPHNEPGGGPALGAAPKEVTVGTISATRPPGWPDDYGAWPSSRRLRP
jgi:hypothetical protein